MLHCKHLPLHGKKADEELTAVHSRKIASASSKLSKDVFFSSIPEYSQTFFAGFRKNNDYYRAENGVFYRIEIKDGKRTTISNTGFYSIGYDINGVYETEHRGLVYEFWIQDRNQYRGAKAYHAIANVLFQFHFPKHVTTRVKKDIINYLRTFTHECKKRQKRYDKEKAIPPSVIELGLAVLTVYDYQLATLRKYLKNQHTHSHGHYSSGMLTLFNNRNIYHREFPIFKEAPYVNTPFQGKILAYKDPNTKEFVKLKKISQLKPYMKDFLEIQGRTVDHELEMSESFGRYNRLKNYCY